MRILTKLKINEVSSVDRGAGEGVKVMLMKRDAPQDIIDGATAELAEYFNEIIVNKRIVNKAAAFGELFESFSNYLKANIDDIIKRNDPSLPLEDELSGADDKKLSDALREATASMVEANPGLHPNRAMRHLMHTPAGRELLNLTISKHKETPMPQVDIMKAVSVLEDVLMARAKLQKRDNETEAKAFSRLYEADIEYRKQWRDLTEVKQSLALSKSFPNMMSIKPVSTVVGSSEFADDSAEALAQLNKLVEEQHARSSFLTTSQLFERVFQDPANAKLVARTYPYRNPDWHTAATDR